MLYFSNQYRRVVFLEKLVSPKDDTSAQLVKFYENSGDRRKEIPQNCIFIRYEKSTLLVALSLGKIKWNFFSKALRFLTENECLIYSNAKLIFIV